MTNEDQESLWDEPKEKESPAQKALREGRRFDESRGDRDPYTGEKMLRYLDSDESERLKKEGITRANANASISWEEAFDQGILSFAKRGVVFTAEEVVAHVGMPDHPNRIGARMNTAARRGVIKKVGYKNAETPSRHAATVAVWQGV